MEGPPTANGTSFRRRQISLPSRPTPAHSATEFAGDVPRVSAMSPYIRLGALPAAGKLVMESMATLGLGSN